jgi:hypothetical protein
LITLPPFRIFKDDISDLCSVWTNNIGYCDITLWVLLVTILFLMSPVLTLALNFLFWVKNAFSQVSRKNIRTRNKRPCIVTILSMYIGHHVILNQPHSYREVFTTNVQPQPIHSLKLKYFLGTIDLILSPLIICLMDIDIRQGIFYIYIRKRTRSITGILR